MEIYSNTTRFALACNISSKVIEPIQSRCAILRYTRLSDSQVLRRLLEICEIEKVNVYKLKVEYTPEGLEAIIFTAEGDMRQGVNNLQSTASNSKLISPTNVYKVCDQPHPVLITSIIQSCLEFQIDLALEKLQIVFEQGFASIDIITTLFRVVKNHEMAEMLKLLYIKEIGMSHMKLLEGNQSLLQLSGLVARLCKINCP
jgi:replication factor C subunit 2/4